MKVFSVVFSLALIFSGLVLSKAAIAQEALLYGIRNDFNGTRAMGMGGAFTAVADDNTAIFYNPAGLMQLTEGESNWFTKLDTDTDALQLYRDLDDARESGDNSASLQEISDLLESNYGKHYSVRSPSLGWLWARPSWGVAVIPTDISIDAGLHQSVGPQLNLRAVNDTTVAFSFNHQFRRFAYGQLAVGLTAKAIYRLEVNRQVSIIDINEDEIFAAEDAREGFTVDADLGVLWVSPWEEYQLKAGLVLRNIGSYGYLAQFSAFGEESGSPGPLFRTLDAGAAVELPGVWHFKHRFALDFRNMGHPNVNLRKAFHMGYEFNGHITSWLKGAFRFGLHQGYLSAGWTGEFAIFRLDLATFSDEVGVQGSRTENRRYMATLSFDF